MASQIHIDEMISALKANAEYIKEAGDSRIRIKNGKFIYQAGEKYVYEFVLEHSQEVDPDAEIEVHIGRSKSTGEIVSLSDQSIQIALEEFIGETGSEAWLVISSYYLIKKLYEQLEAAKSGEVTIGELGDKLINVIDQDSVSPYPDSRKVVEHQLNDEQLEALNSSHNNEITYLWGPPGTGKTQTIASIIESYIDNDLSVLLLSHANKAVDEALLKTAKHLIDARNSDIEEGRIIRFGDIYHSELKEFEDIVVPEKIAERKTKELRYQITELKDEESKKLTKLAKINNDLESFRVLQKQTKALSDKTNYLEILKSEYKDIRHKTKQLNVSNQKDKQTINEYEAKGSIGKFFSGEKPEQIKARISERRNQILVNDKTEANLRSSVSKGLKELEEIQNEIKNAEKLCKGKDSAKLEASGHKIVKEVESLREEIAEIEEHIATITELLIADAKLVATTLTKSYLNPSVLSRRYDCVIVDEVSMAPLPAVWFAASLAQKRVMVVGDFFQLPPVVKHEPIKSRDVDNDQFELEQQLVDTWLRKDIFDYTGITSAVQSAKNIPVSGFVQLRKQYRMDKLIADLVNHLVYGKYGKQYALETSRGTNKNLISALNGEPAPSSRLAVFDTAGLKPYDTKTDSGSYYNLQHALICVELAKRSLDSGYKTAGIVTAYRAQADLLQKIIADSDLGKQITAETVHRFQGGEQEIIVFDVTTSRSPSPYDDMEALGGDEKLINVALSRTKEKCILVADVESTLKKHSDSSAIRSSIGFIANHKLPTIDAKVVIDEFEAQTDIDKWLAKIDKLEDPKNSSVFDDSNFYQNFLHDASKAQREIIIDSPFLTVARTEKMLPHLKSAMTRGVKVFVISRKISDHAGNMKSQAEKAIKLLDNAGVVVLTFGGKIHEKIAIIDRKLLWHGSLNIMSQNTSKESMFRFNGGNVATQLLKNLGFDKNVGKIGENKLEKCVFCKEPTAWCWTGKSRYGVWTYCMANYHAKDKPPKTKAEQKKAAKATKAKRRSKKEMVNGVPICPDHNVEMIKKKGRFGEFWGCPYYSKRGCRITEKITP